MARRKAPELTIEERDRLRREAADLQRARCTAAAQALQPTAQAFLAARGVLLPGDGVRERLVRMDAYRKALSQTSAQPAYKPTVRQQQARPLPGIDVEVEF